jgi:hypothetical protein
VSASLAAIDAALRDLPAIVGLPPDRVLFTLYGFRYPGDEANGRGTYFDLMRRILRTKAESFGYEVIDLDPASSAIMRRIHRDSSTRTTATGMRSAIQ